MIVMDSVCIGETHQIHPVLRHVFAVSRRGHQSKDELGIRIGSFVGQKRADLVERGREPRQIEGDASNQCAFVRTRRRGEPLLSQARAITN